MSTSRSAEGAAGSPGGRVAVLDSDRRLPSLGLTVCTARAAVAQRARGLRLGVDDWLAKPCHPEEVVARGEAVVRRRAPVAPRAVRPLQTGGLVVRPDRYQAFAGEQSADLARREFTFAHA